MMFNLSAACIVKNEASYLEEWLSYHICIGFEHFYVFDNGSTDSTIDVLSPFIKYGYVTLINWPLFPGQVDAYNYTIKIFGSQSKWVAFFDPDEFFVLKKNKNMYEYLSKSNADQILVFWKMFGHSGYENRPDGLVIENYLYSEDKKCPVVKCIVRPEKVKSAYVHNCVTTSGNTTNDRGIYLNETWAHESKYHSVEYLQLNHYFTKSYQEYISKIERGQVDGKSQKKIESFENFNYVSKDDTILNNVNQTRDFISFIKKLKKQPIRYGSLTNIGSISSARGFQQLSLRLLNLFASGHSDSELLHNFFGTGCFLPITNKEITDQLNSLIEYNVLTSDMVILRGINFDSASDFCFSSCQTDCINMPLLINSANDDPYIYINTALCDKLNFFVASIVIEVFSETVMEFYAIGDSAHGEPITEYRRIPLVPGVHFGLYIINDTPMVPNILRCDLGEYIGKYVIHHLKFYQLQLMEQSC